jgi:membrane protein implicated in regulation of membrane protease activity
MRSFSRVADPVAERIDRGLAWRAVPWAAGKDDGMQWDDPDLWRWLWLSTAVVFALGEMAIPTSFFLASFALGAVIAAVVAFLGGALLLQWVLFVGVATSALLFLRPLSRRLDRDTADVANVGANRWVGKLATVINAVPDGPGETGLIRLEREEWRAESTGNYAIAPGTRVRVVRVDGTRMVVEPVEAPSVPPAPSTD